MPDFQFGFRPVSDERRGEEGFAGAYDAAFGKRECAGQQISPACVEVEREPGELLSFADGRGIDVAELARPVQEIAVVLPFMQLVDGFLRHMENDLAGRVRFAFCEELVLVGIELDLGIGDGLAVGDAPGEEDDAAGGVGDCCRDQREIGEHELAVFGLPVGVVVPVGLSVVRDLKHIIAGGGEKDPRSLVTGIVDHEDVIDVEQMVDRFVPGIGKLDGLLADQEHIGRVDPVVPIVGR